MSDMVRLHSGWPAKDEDVRRVWHQLTILADQKPTALRAVLLSTRQPSTAVSRDIADELLRRGLVVHWDRPSGQLSIDDSIRAIIGASIDDDDRGQLIYPADPQEIRLQAPPDGEAVSWYWDEQVDLVQLGEFVTGLSAGGKVYFIEVDVPGESPRMRHLVISNQELTVSEAREVLAASHG